jgi:hypothetical protein
MSVQSSSVTPLSTATSRALPNAGTGGSREATFTALQAASFSRFRDDLAHVMPACAYRNYYAWMLSEPRRSERLLQAIGHTQLLTLYTYLLDGLVAPPLQSDTFHRCAAMIHYQIFEVVSDNLAFGLVGHDITCDAAASERRALLLGFNAGMQRRLQGDPTPASTLLRPLRDLANRVASERQTLCGDIHLESQRAYADTTGSASSDDIARSIWPSLVANIETCTRHAALAGDGALATYLRSGLLRRYEAVDTLLRTTGQLALRTRLSLGADTILVVPTVAFLLIVAIQPTIGSSRLADVTESGLLKTALERTAVIVRLLNDIGAPLLHHSARRRLFADTVDATARANGNSTLTDVVVRAAHLDAAGARLQKDALHGEFNICLDGIREHRATPTTLTAFHHRVTFFAEQFDTAKRELAHCLTELDRRLQTPAPSELIRRFVDFNEQVYSRAFTSTEGEFAI